jgi:TonB-linked SusC/RagA family outer membrane protein
MKKNLIIVKPSFYSTNRKKLQIMKLLVLCLVLSVFNVAGSVFSQKTTFNMSYENVSVGEVLHEIESTSDYKFLYRTDLVDVNRKINLQANNNQVEEILGMIFPADDASFRFFEDNLIAITGNPLTFQQHGVTGIVTDADTGEPLPGVNIMIQGTTTGTVTDVNGRYSLTAEENASLVFSFVGYESVVMPVEGRIQINVRLVPSLMALDEVVVSALGIRRDRRGLPYAITEVGGEDFTQAREINLGSALTGRIAGVNATSQATGPGGSSHVIIRGSGSLAGSVQPLYIINGVPIDNSGHGSAGTYGGRDGGDGLSSLNPDDIQSISVLKGGSAAALYGSRAANGVILITTKSGRAEQGIGVEFSSSYTNETVIDYTDWQYEYGAGNRGVAPASQTEAIGFGRTSWGARLDGSMVMNPDGVERPYVGHPNNVRNFYDTGGTFTNTLAITGGEAVNFRFSASNMDHNGVVPNSSMGRNTFNLRANAALADRLTFEGSAQYSIENVLNRTPIADFTRNPNAAVGVIASSVDVRTLAPGYDERGYETHWSDYVFVANPYFATSKVSTEDERQRFIGSFSTQYDITDNIYARARLGMDHYNRSSENINPSGSLIDERGSVSSGLNIRYETNLEFILGFNRRFEPFSVVAFVGGNQMYSQNNTRNLASGDLNVPFRYFIANGSNPTFSHGFSEQAINSVFGSADIGFNDYLYLTMTGRQDWFSTLAIESNSLFYPSVGLSFVFSDVWEGRPAWMNYGKIYSSWAQVGSGAPSPYGLDLEYVAQTQSHLGQPLMSIRGNTIPARLTPYTSTTIEFGLEMRALDGRMFGEIALYEQTTTDDIVNATIPRPSGYTAVALNVGEIRNRGIEFTLGGTPVRTANGFRWGINYNMAYNDSEVLKISDELTSIQRARARSLNGFIFHFEGEPYGMIAGFRALRDANGNVVYNPVNGMPLQSEFTSLGRGIPPLTIGLSNNLRYNNFFLDFMLDSKWGAKIYSTAHVNGAFFGLDKRTVENNVRETGITVSGVDPGGNPYSATVSAQDYYQNTSFRITEDYVSDAGFIKLRQFSFGYTVPRSLLAGTPIQHADISLVGRNLLMLYSQVEGIDPESSYNAANAYGLENFGVPPARSFGINLMVRF